MRSALTALFLSLVLTSWLPADTVIQVTKVRVFDGSQFRDNQTVTFTGGSILSVGNYDGQPDVVIDGTGKTLLPGLIDCHVHAFFPQHLEQAAIFGVTTVLDMMSMPQMASIMRRQNGTETAAGRAWYMSAGAAVTVKGGHGTQFGFPVPVLDTPEAAKEFVTARVAEGSDYIKIILDDGKSFGISFKTLSDDMLVQAIKASHELDKLAVAHVSSHEAAAKAIEGDIDGLVHLFADQIVSDQLLQIAKDKGTFVVPTATIVTSVCGRDHVASHLEDERLAPYLTKGNEANLRRKFPQRAGMPSTAEKLMKNIKVLHDAGIPILAGTDAPNPGTVHGASLHVELALLVEAGLTTDQALAAATSLPAKAFRIADRGRIEPGQRADLVLVNGNPQQDISATRNIDRVWVAGFEVDREKRRQAVQAAEEGSDG